MGIQPWHISVLVMTAVVLPPAVHWFVGWLRQSGPGDHGSPKSNGQTLLRTRTVTLAILTVVLLALGIIAVLLVPAAVNVVAAVASALSAVVSAALTIVSFLTLQDRRTEAAQKASAVTEKTTEADG